MVSNLYLVYYLSIQFSQVYVRRAVSKRNEDMTASQGNANDHAIDILGGNGIPMIRKSKLLVVDLAGSERINKSGCYFLWPLPNPCISPFF